MTGHHIPMRRALRAPLALLTCFAILALSGCVDRELPTALGPDGPAFTQVATSPVVNSLAINGNGMHRVLWIDRTALNVTISGLTITGGYATTGGGGGILNWTNLTVTDCAITGNATHDAGGGIRSLEGTLLVVSTAISGNRGQDISSGVSSETPASTTFVNSTISGNLTPYGSPGSGVFSRAGLTRIIHSTITGNSTGVLVYTGSSAEVRGSIIWGNSATDVSSYPTGLVSSLGHNLVGTTFNATFAATGDQTAVSDAPIGPLQLNAPGGTATHALLSGSPALDAGTCTDHTGATVATDQRGVTRPQGSGCDIGAYEEETPATEVNTFDDHDDGACDASDCTLREAIAHAGSGTTITFASSVTGTIYLASPIVIITPLAIHGPGAGALAVVGGFFRVFDVQPIEAGQVEIRGLTIRDGQSETNGAGIIIRSARVLLEEVAVRNNRWSTSGLEFGGGIGTDGTSTVTIRNSSITGNQSPNDGGGISVSAGSTLTVENSTISGNSASRYGAGLYSAGTVTLISTTIHGNHASVGGGVFIHDGSFDLSFSTIASNSATWYGGGVYRLVGSGTLEGTILGGGNTAAEYPDLAGESGGVAASYSLIQSAGDATVFGISPGVDGSIVGYDPILDASLIDNGGSTQTRALLTGSPAIDQIPSGTTGCGSVVTTDQRGVTRPQGSACDIGAFEWEGTSGPIAPEFTFDLSGLSKTYGNPDFSVAGYVSTNSTGDVTFALGSSSVGCSVTSVGMVSITGAATGGAVSFIAEGTCTLEAAVAEGTNWLATTGDPQSVPVTGGSTPSFTSACVYESNPRNERRLVTITWEKADPGVTLIRLESPVTSSTLFTSTIGHSPPGG